MMGKKNGKVRVRIYSIFLNIEALDEKFCLHVISDLLQERKMLLECIYKVY